MLRNVSETGRVSYATFHTSASALRRPKTDYGISLEATRRSEGKNTRRTASQSSHAEAEQAVRQLACPHWSGIHETSNMMQPTTPSTKATTRSLSTSLGQCTSTSQHCLTSPRREKHVTLARSDTDMDDAASALLSQLQQVVVRVSHQMVDERRRSVQQRKQIQALETIVAEQDAMLDVLRTQCDAAQNENSRLLKNYQKELRLRSTNAAQTNQSGVGSHGSTEIRISAAQVDNCVCDEFRRLSPIYASYALSWFDEVSPIVAAVLRSLATEVLQMRNAAQKDETEATAVPYAEPLVPRHPRAARSSLSETASEPLTPLLMPSVNKHALVAGRHRAGVVDSVIPTASPENETQVSVSPAAASRPSSAPSVTAGRINREKSELFCADVAAKKDSATNSGARAASETSSFVAGSVYEDAASILSDIRARYGL